MTSTQSPAGASHMLRGFRLRGSTLTIMIITRALVIPWSEQRNGFLAQCLAFLGYTPDTTHSLGSFEIPTRLQFSPDKTLFRALSI